jgi:myo-inositol-hexaphosphate 3-phosphohydrolase
LNKIRRNEDGDNDYDNDDHNYDFNRNSCNIGLIINSITRLTPLGLFKLERYGYTVSENVTQPETCQPSGIVYLVYGFPVFRTRN